MAIALSSFVILVLTTCEISTTKGATIECGNIGNIRDTVRILRGKETIRGEWPFLAALFLVKEKENAFFCGGSLISSKHVLTAAHCIQDKGSGNKLYPGNISIVLGAYNLTSNTEIGVQQRDVQEIYIHPEWNVYSDKYDADLAIILLNEVVLFTNYIRPVCIPKNDRVMEGVEGSVIGWGLTGNSTRLNTEFIKRAAVTAINAVYCLTEYPDVAFISSTRTFCGQGKDGNADRGDSGGGFYVKNEEYLYVQRGVVSSMRTNSRGHADSVVVYTNVAIFKNWIADTVNQTALNLECVFEYRFEKYTCFIDNVDIQSENIVMGSFSGSHKSRKTDRDVEQIRFRNGTLFFIPSGVGQIFKNLKIMEIEENLNTKRIKRSDFKNLENLILFKIYKNEITTFDHDILRDLQQLEEFYILENRLTEIEESTLEANTNLKNLLLYGNKLEMLPRHLFQNNLLLEYVDIHSNFLKIIDESTFETNINLKTVELSYNKLEMLPRHLFRNNLLLKEIYLRSNRLTIIEADFTSLKNIEHIFFQENICIGAYYGGYMMRVGRMSNQFYNLTDFQSLIRTNCSSTKK